MINQEQREFAKYAIGRMVQQLALAQPSPQEFIGQLAGVVPELNATEGVTKADFKPTMWNDKIAEIIVDHYAEEYPTGKLRTA